MRKAECSRNKGGDVATAGRRDAWIEPPAGAVAVITIIEALTGAADTTAVAVDSTASQDAA